MSSEYEWLHSQLTQAGNILWLADENAKPWVELTTPNPSLTLLTNRYDIYCQAKNHGHPVLFNDFDFSTVTLPIDKVICRIPKEKSLLHYLTIESQRILNGKGEFVTFGQKNQGIKSHHQWIKKHFAHTGNLKKHTNDYHGHYCLKASNNHSIDNDYTETRIIDLPENGSLPEVFSKPGVFGWNKIDSGSQLLIEEVRKYFASRALPRSLADIGCGYGWLLLNLKDLEIPRLLGTDNNAAALTCAVKNMSRHHIDAQIIAADCVSTITEKVDCVVCNPPFHQGFDHAKQQTEKFVKGCSSILNKQGVCFFVVNQFVGIQSLIDDEFTSSKQLISRDGFTVIVAKKE